MSHKRVVRCGCGVISDSEGSGLFDSPAGGSKPIKHKCGNLTVNDVPQQSRRAVCMKSHDNV